MTDLLICASTNLFRIYLISRFIHTFLGDEGKENRSGRMIHMLAYGGFFAANTVSYLAFHRVWVNIFCNLVGIGLIVLTYTRSLKMILFVTGAVYIINMGCSMISVLPFIDYKDGVGFNQIYEVFDIFLILVCELLTEKSWTPVGERRAPLKFLCA